MDDMQVYIANLGKYNEGELVGAWFTFPIDFEEVKEKIGLNDEYEEYAIHDYELPFTVDEYTSIGELMPLYRGIIARAMAGDFGKLNLATLNFGSYKPYDPENHFFSRNRAGGAMLEIGVYPVTLARLFMVSQPVDVISICNACETGVDVTSGIVMRNAEMQMATITMSLHSKQPKRAMLSFEDCYIEIMNYPRADHATITWTADNRREEVHLGEEAYALCYEVADLERAAAGDEIEHSMLAYTVDNMQIMTQLRRQWGVTYPEEEGLA